MLLSLDYLPACPLASSLSRQIAASWLVLEKQQRTVWLPTNHFHEDFSNTSRLIPKGSVGWANVTSVTVFLEFLGGIRSFDAASRKAALFPTLRDPREISYHFHGVHSVFVFYFFNLWLPLFGAVSRFLSPFLLFVNAIT